MREGDRRLQYYAREDGDSREEPHLLVTLPCRTGQSKDAMKRTAAVRCGSRRARPSE
jgi:hypothetical protein